ncbi:MAG TPA: hypothetical protein VH796_11445, partial [Nitrososphaeraceae archaeon]
INIVILLHIKRYEDSSIFNQINLWTQDKDILQNNLKLGHGSIRLDVKIICIQKFRILNIVILYLVLELLVIAKTTHIDDIYNRNKMNNKQQCLSLTLMPVLLCRSYNWLLLPASTW